MSRPQLTLLIEDFGALVAAAGDAACPVLERALARGRPFRKAAAEADRLRLELFSLAHDGPAPVAALTALADGLAAAGDGRYWLRVDPVTLTADMTRVFMTAHGLADVGATDREELRGCIAAAAAAAGHDLLSGHPERWCLPLPAAPGCAFTGLDEALGRDLADVLPAGEAGREWRRLLTDIQVALHHAPAGRRRREAGFRAINGAWIWGGGHLPAAPGDARFDRLIGDHPVSRGLAVLAGTVIESQPGADFTPRFAAGDRILLDWTVGRSGAAAELARIEALAGRLLPAVRRGELDLELVDGGGAAWRIERGGLRRFWRGRRPLRESVQRVHGS